MSAPQPLFRWCWVVGNYEVTLAPNLPLALWRYVRARWRGYTVHGAFFGFGYLYDINRDDCRWGVRFLTLNVWEVQSTYRQRGAA